MGYGRGGAMGDPYAVLGFDACAGRPSAEAVRAAFRARVLEVHPDKVPEGRREEAHAEFVAVKRAYEEVRVSYEEKGAAEDGGGWFDGGRGWSPRAVYEAFFSRFTASFLSTAAAGGGGGSPAAAEGRGDGACDEEYPGVGACDEEYPGVGSRDDRRRLRRSARRDEERARKQESVERELARQARRQARVGLRAEVAGDDRRLAAYIPPRPRGEAGDGAAAGELRIFLPPVPETHCFGAARAMTRWELEVYPSGADRNRHEPVAAVAGRVLDDSGGGGPAQARVAGLAPGARHWFRVRFTGINVQGPWSCEGNAVSSAGDEKPGACAADRFKDIVSSFPTDGPVTRSGGGDKASRKLPARPHGGMHGASEGGGDAGRRESCARNDEEESRPWLYVEDAIVVPGRNPPVPTGTAGTVAERQEPSADGEWDHAPGGAEEEFPVLGRFMALGMVDQAQVRGQDEGRGAPTIEVGSAMWEGDVNPMRCSAFRGGDPSGPVGTIFDDFDTHQSVPAGDDEARWIPSQLFDDDDVRTCGPAKDTALWTGAPAKLPSPTTWSTGIMAAPAAEPEGIWGRLAQEDFSPGPLPPPGRVNRDGGGIDARELCRFYASGKLCQRGVRCPFWHDPSLGLKPPLCRWTANGEPCPRGRRCPFAHDVRLASQDVEREDDLPSRRRGHARAGRGRPPPRAHQTGEDTHPAGGGRLSTSAGSHYARSRARAVPLA